LTEDVLATERVYELVKRGVPFRDAYRMVGKRYG
jgi:argininosuccinate lyase